ESGDLLGDENALLEPAVGQLQTGNEVAYRVHVRQIGTQSVIGADEPALHGEPVLLVTQSRGVRATADGDEQQIRIQRFTVLQRDTHAVLVLGGAGEFDTGLEGDLSLTEGTLQLFGGELVLVRDEPWQRLHNGHVGTERCPYAGELDADHTAAEHNHLVRYVIQ